TASLTVTITGSNDAPTAADDAASVREDVTLSASGNVISNDGDPDGDALAVSAVNGAAANVGASVGGAYGSVTVAVNGAYAYTLNNSSAAVQALKAGQAVTDVFSYTVSDGNGGASTATLTVTITGSNDAPTAGTISGRSDADSSVI